MPLKEVPLIRRIKRNTVEFIDGSHEDFDAIVMCTGYLHHFPFLPDDLRLVSSNRMYAPDLYKSVVSWLEREALIENSEDTIDFQGAYIRDLLQDADYPDFEVEEQAELFKLRLRQRNHSNS